jgi:hypothetical protein
MRISTIGSLSGALLLAGLAAGCSSTPTTEPTSSSAVVQSPSETPTPTTSGTETDAACLALLDDATIAAFDTKGWSYDADFAARELTDPSMWEDYVTDPLTCRYGGEDDDGIIYGGAAITDAKATALKAQLKDTLGTLDVSDDGTTYTAVDSYTVRVKFGDGYAVYSVGEPDVIDELATNSAQF